MGFFKKLVHNIGRLGGNDKYGSYTAWGLLGDSDKAKAADAEAARIGSIPAINPDGSINPEWVNYHGANPQEMAAVLLSSQFNEWQRQYMPIELKAMQGISFNNPEVLPRALSEATDIATRQSDAMEGIAERQNAALGVAPTPQQEQVSERILDLSRAANVASARNQARANVRTIDESILLGTAPNPNIIGGRG